MSSSKVALGAVLGGTAAYLAAGALGLDGVIDPTTQEVGLNAISEAIKSGAVAPGDVGYSVAPSGWENFLNHLQQQLSNNLAVTPDHSIIISASDSQFVIKDVTGMENLLNNGSLDAGLQEKLQGIVDSFKASLPPVMTVPVAGGAPVPTLAADLPLSELLKQTTGVDAIAPDKIAGLHHFTLANGTDIHLHPEWTQHVEKLTSGLDGEKAEAVRALASHFDNARSIVDTQTLMTAGGVGIGAVGTASLGKAKTPQEGRRFTDRVQPKAPMAEIAAKKSDGQPWAQTVQAGAEQTPPQVTR